MEFAKVNNYEEAKMFFDEYNIPYEIVTRGKNKGKLRIKKIRHIDGLNLIETSSRLKNSGYDYVVDHSNCFRDADNNTVCTFSPYIAEKAPEGLTWLKVSNYSIYGMLTKTFAVVVEN